MCSRHQFCKASSFCAVGVYCSFWRHLACADTQIMLQQQHTGRTLAYRLSLGGASSSGFLSPASAGQHQKTTGTRQEHSRKPSTAPLGLQLAQGNLDSPAWRTCISCLHFQHPTAHCLLVQGCNGVQGLRDGVELDESEALGVSRVAHQPAGINLAIRGEELHQGLLRQQGGTQATDVEVGVLRLC